MQESIIKKANIIQRIITAMVLIPIVIGAILFSKLLVQIMLVLVSIGMFSEWYEMTSNKTLDMIYGIPTIAVPISCLILLTILVGNYKYVLMTYLAVIWAVDSVAMFGGRTLGGPKLAPVLSPNKTWSGLRIYISLPRITACYICHMFCSYSADE
jgi:phosphatidate cytidylyltransferase